MQRVALVEGRLDLRVGVADAAAGVGAGGHFHLVGVGGEGRGRDGDGRDEGEEGRDELAPLLVERRHLLGEWEGVISSYPEHSEVAPCPGEWKQHGRKKGEAITTAYGRKTRSYMFSWVGEEINVIRTSGQEWKVVRLRDGPCRSSVPVMVTPSRGIFSPTGPLYCELLCVKFLTELPVSSSHGSVTSSP